jgi:hypothetical protein
MSDEQKPQRIAVTTATGPVYMLTGFPWLVAQTGHLYVYSDPQRGELLAVFAPGDWLRYVPQDVGTA